MFISAAFYMLYFVRFVLCQSSNKQYTVKNEFLCLYSKFWNYLYIFMQLSVWLFIFTLFLKLPKIFIKQFATKFGVDCT